MGEVGEIALPRRLALGDPGEDMDARAGGGIGEGERVIEACPKPVSGPGNGGIAAPAGVPVRLRRVDEDERRPRRVESMAQVGGILAIGLQYFHTGKAGIGRRVDLFPHRRVAEEKGQVRRQFHGRSADGMTGKKRPPDQSPNHDVPSCS